MSPDIWIAASAALIKQSKEKQMEKKLIEMGKKYKTGNGLSVEILRTDIKHEQYPVLAVITLPDGLQEVWQYTKFGNYYSSGSTSRYDLTEQPEVVTKELWLELTESGDVYPWGTENLAAINKDKFTVAIKKITVEFIEGEGL